MRHLVPALVLAVLAPVAVAPPASAAVDTGAQHYSFTDCFTAEPNVRVCVKERGVFHVAERSGRLHVTDNFHGRSTVTGPGVSYRSRFNAHFTLLLERGQEQVVHVRVRYHDTYNDVSCRGRYRFMIVRGEVKKELESFTCDGPLT